MRWEKGGFSKDGYNPFSDTTYNTLVTLYNINRDDSVFFHGEPLSAHPEIPEPFKLPYSLDFVNYCLTPEWEMERAYLFKQLDSYVALQDVWMPQWSHIDRLSHKPSTTIKSYIDAIFHLKKSGLYRTLPYGTTMTMYAKYKSFENTGEYTKFGEIKSLINDHIHDTYETGNRVKVNNDFSSEGIANTMRLYSSGTVDTRIYIPASIKFTNVTKPFMFIHNLYFADPKNTDDSWSAKYYHTYTVTVTRDITEDTEIDIETIGFNALLGGLSRFSDDYIIPQSGYGSSNIRAVLDFGVAGDTIPLPVYINGEYYDTDYDYPTGLTERNLVHYAFYYDYLAI